MLVAPSHRCLIRHPAVSLPRQDPTVIASALGSTEGPKNHVIRGRGGQDRVNSISGTYVGNAIFSCGMDSGKIARHPQQRHGVTAESDIGCSQPVKLAANES